MVFESITKVSGRRSAASTGYDKHCSRSSLASGARRVRKPMGHATEDVVTASLVYQAAVAEGAGTSFAMENLP
jgi:hypothetical protein